MTKSDAEQLARDEHLMSEKIKDKRGRSVGLANASRSDALSMRLAELETKNTGAFVVYGQKMKLLEDRQCDFESRIEQLVAAVRILLHAPPGHALSAQEAESLKAARESL